MKRFLVLLVAVILLLVSFTVSSFATGAKVLEVCLFNKEGHLIHSFQHNIFMEKGVYNFSIPKNVQGEYIFKRSKVDIKVTSSGISPSIICILVEPVKYPFAESYLLTAENFYSYRGGVLVTRQLATALSGNKDIYVPFYGGNITLDLGKCSLTDDTLLNEDCFSIKKFKKPIEVASGRFMDAGRSYEFDSPKIGQDYVFYDPRLESSEICTYIFDAGGNLLHVDLQTFKARHYCDWNLYEYEPLYWIPHVSSIASHPTDEMPWVTCVVVQKKYPDNPEMYPEIDPESFATISGKKAFVHSVLVTAQMKEVFAALGKDSITLPCKNGEVEISLTNASDVVSTFLTEEVVVNKK